MSVVAEYFMEALKVMLKRNFDVASDNRSNNTLELFLCYI
jgi:hypothetical protein